MQTIADRMIYLVIVGHSGGDYLPEQNVADLDRGSVVSLIASGEYEDLKQVLECNPAEGICRDVTEDICNEVCDRFADNGEPLTSWQYEFVEFTRGTAAANSFARAA